MAVLKMFNVNSIQEYLEGFKTDVINSVNSIDINQVTLIAKLLYDAKEAGKNIFFFGNGGSHSIASHLACDLGKGAKSMNNDRKMYRTFSLDNESWLTALANDGEKYFTQRNLPGKYNHGYDGAFVGQMENFLNEGDIAVGISSSGNSQNVLNALLFAKAKKAKTIAIVGFDGGEAAKIADNAIVVKSPKGQYGLVEGVHEIIHHMIYEVARDIELVY